MNGNGSNGTIERLKELAMTLPPLPVEAVSANRVDVETDAGTAVGINLLVSPLCSILNWTMAPGTHYQAHAHEEQEWIIITAGKMRIRLAVESPTRLIVDHDGWFVLSAGDYIHIPPQTPHEAVFDAFTEAVTVHIPCSKDYSSWEKTPQRKTISGSNTGSSSLVSSSA